MVEEVCRVSTSGSFNFCLLLSSPLPVVDGVVIVVDEVVVVVDDAHSPILVRIIEMCVVDDEVDDSIGERRFSLVLYK